MFHRAGESVYRIYTEDTSKVLYQRGEGGGNNTECGSTV